MSFKNTAAIRSPAVHLDPLEAPHRDTPLDEYDHNCIFPIRELRSDRVIVTPFIPSLHAQAYLDGSKLDEFGIFRWVPWGPFEDLPSILRFLEMGRKDKTVSLFAVLDASTGSPRFAGVLKLYQCDMATLSVEIGNVLVLPPFRRTHVLTHGLSLLLTYCFTPPSSSPSVQGGLGLRRVQWTAAPANASSIVAATRMGFKFEGILRNRWMWPRGKEGLSFDQTGELPMSVEGTTRGASQDAWVGGITKGDWEAAGGVRELVGRQMSRVA